jgi:hypothetical protein
MDWSKASDRSVMDLLFHRPVAAPSGFPELLSFDLDAAGQALTTWTTAEGKKALTHHFTSGTRAPPFRSSTSLFPTDIAVVEHQALEDQVTILPQITTAFIKTQCLLDGFLVVGARCRWTSKHIDKNALRFDRSGQLVQEATLGDGIEHIATTPKGLTWVGYFDEGVFGNYGWDNPGPRAIGRYGINCFNSNLQLIAHAPGKIYDCYAMNVAGEAVYACPYSSDWSIRHLDSSGRETTWSNMTRGARHLIVSGNEVALIGGYEGPDRIPVDKLGDERFRARNLPDRVVIGRLENGNFRVLKTSSLKLAGERLPSTAMLASRGHELHALLDQVWYRCELKT